MEVPAAGQKKKRKKRVLIRRRQKLKKIRQRVDSPPFPSDGGGGIERIAAGTCPVRDVCGPIWSLSHRARSGSRSSACVRPTGSSRSPPPPAPPSWTGGRGWTSPGSRRHGQRVPQTHILAGRSAGSGPTHHSVTFVSRQQDVVEVNICKRPQSVSEMFISGNCPNTKPGPGLWSS